MPSLESVKNFRKGIFDQSMALIDKKGHDYNRRQQIQGDTLFNLKVCELLGIVPTTERGILVRCSDKFMRLISLMDADVLPANAGESVTDTVVDLHNYLDYALQVYLERIKSSQMRMPTQKPAPEPEKSLDDQAVRDWYKKMLDQEPKRIARLGNYGEEIL